MKQIFTSLWLLSLLACTKTPTPPPVEIPAVNPPVETPQPPAVVEPTKPNTPTTTTPSTPTTTPKQVISGWLPEYDQHIIKLIDTKYPELYKLDAARMKNVCPKWNSVDKKKFWPALLQSISVPESSQNRTTMFVESTMGTDPVTKKQIRSEGLFQISYQDKPNYKRFAKNIDEECPIDWAKDSAMFYADLAKCSKATCYGNPERTILSAYTNISCTVFFMKAQLFQLFPSKSFDYALGQYWYVMKINKDAFPKVMAGLKKRIPECF